MTRPTVPQYLAIGPVPGEVRVELGERQPLEIGGRGVGRAHDDGFAPRRAVDRGDAHRRSDEGEFEIDEVLGLIRCVHGEFVAAALVPRTRSSHTRAARPIANFGFKRGTRIIYLPVCLLIPKFASECAASVCELRNRDTSRVQPRFAYWPRPSRL